MKISTFKRTGPDGRTYRFKCEAVVMGIPINPKLSRRFDDTPNEIRTPREKALWGLPFIRQVQMGHPVSKRTYEIRRLDGGAWDRSTWLGYSHNKQVAVLMAVGKLAEGHPDYTFGRGI